MHLIGIILFAMAVGLGALFLLAKAQKDNLGKLYTISGYVVFTVSVLTIVFAITAGILFACCHHNDGKCGKGKCKTENCYKGGHGSCKADGHSGALSCSGGSCSKSGGMDCMKGGDCMMMAGKGGKMKGCCMKKKIMKIIDGDSVNVDVKIIE